MGFVLGAILLFGIWLILFKGIIEWFKTDRKSTYRSSHARKSTHVSHRMPDRTKENKSNKAKSNKPQKFVHSKVFKVVTKQLNGTKGTQVERMPFDEILNLLYEKYYHRYIDDCRFTFASRFTYSTDVNDRVAFLKQIRILQKGITQQMHGHSYKPSFYALVGRDVSNAQKIINNVDILIGDEDNMKGMSYDTIYIN